MSREFPAFDDEFLGETVDRRTARAVRESMGSIVAALNAQQPTATTVQAPAPVSRVAQPSVVSAPQPPITIHNHLSGSENSGNGWGGVIKVGSVIGGVVLAAALFQAKKDQTATIGDTIRQTATEVCARVQTICDFIPGLTAFTESAGTGSSEPIPSSSTVPGGESDDLRATPNGVVPSSLDSVLEPTITCYPLTLATASVQQSICVEGLVQSFVLDSPQPPIIVMRAYGKSRQVQLDANGTPYSQGTTMQPIAEWFKADATLCGSMMTAVTVSQVNNDGTVSVIGGATPSAVGNQAVVISGIDDAVTGEQVCRW